MKKDAKIYIAGHRGLVGSAIFRKMQAEGYTNVLTRTHTELDLERQAEVEAFFRAENPEYVFLAAAKVGGIWANNTYPAQFIYNNLIIQTTVLHTAWKLGVKRLLLLGSSCIYPRECPQPMKEEYLFTGPLEPTNEAYAVAKIAGIIQCGAYNRQYGTHYLAAVPTNLYGPNDNYDLQNCHVLPALIRKLHLAKLAAQGDWEGIKKDEAFYGPLPEDVMADLIAISQSRDQNVPDSFERDAPSTLRFPGMTLWGSGSSCREFLHADDLADACVFLMNLKNDAFDSLFRVERLPLINIGCSQDQTIQDLASLVAKIVGYKDVVTWDQTKPDGMPRKLSDISRLTGLNWKPKVSLKDGIETTYEWYLKEPSAHS